MIKPQTIWLLMLWTALSLVSCQKKAPPRVKTAEELAREVERDALVQEGLRVVKVFEELQPIFANIHDIRTMKKAEFELNSLQNKLKTINREIHLREKPDKELKNQIHFGMRKQKEHLKNHILSAMRTAEDVPPDLFVRSNQALSNFINGDHGLGEVMQKYFRPEYDGEPIPSTDPEIVEARKKMETLAEMQAINKNSNASETASLADAIKDTEKVIYPDEELLPIIEDPAIPKAQPVPEDDE